MNLAAIFAELEAWAEWEVSAYGDSFICPCGVEIETDGECPNGHVSPLVALGMI